MSTLDPLIAAFYHGTPAELTPGDQIELGHPPSWPEYQGQPPRDHVYLSPRRDYISEHYGPGVGQNLYEVEPTGSVTHDPEYRNRRMLRSKEPLRVVRKISAAHPLDVREYEGEEGNRDHITRNEIGTIPLDWVRDLKGASGEHPDVSPWHKRGQEWEDFKGAVARGEGGAGSHIFVTVNHGEEPRISEGNQRRDAHVELGHTHIPAEIRYFGHAERQGTLEQRHMRRTAAYDPVYTWHPAGGRWYHGTPDERGWEHGAAYGIHVGTEDAAHEALNARIGKPAEGKWDGTREYGKTLVDGRLWARNREGERFQYGGEIRYPTGHAQYSNKDYVPLDARPSVFPVRIKGPMVNSTHDPVHDDYANSRLRGQITRGNARRGYFYTNASEDEGSISAAVPSAAHLERIRNEEHTAAFEEGEECPWCGEPHESDPVEEHWHELHQPWGHILRDVHTLHRGIGVQLPAREHAFVHDPAGNRSEQAAHLLKHVHGPDWEHMHWSSQEGHDFARDEFSQHGLGDQHSMTNVVLHAQKPQPEHIEDDPDRILKEQAWPHGYPEFEVPLARHAPVSVTGISWRHGNQGEWRHHQFGRPRRIEASKGEGYITCDQGHEHWGRHGAAGLLIRHRDDDSSSYRYLLQRRGETSDHPGTWGIFGGALHEGEPSYAGARRETAEELGGLPRMKRSHSYEDDHGGWSYTTHVVDAREPFMPDRSSASTGAETAGHGWFTAREMKDLPLHPGFAKSLPSVLRSRKTAQVSGFFHGSAHDFSPGDVIDPAQSHASAHGATPAGTVAFTTSPNKAYLYGRLAGEKLHGNGDLARVYRVEPAGEYQRDTGGNAHDSYLTRAPLRVTEIYRDRPKRKTAAAGSWHVDVKLKKGYELPDWHKPDHAEPEGAHAEAEKIRQWAAGQPGVLQGITVRYGKTAATYPTEWNRAHVETELPTLYHGTNHPFREGDYIEPGHPTHYPEAYDEGDDHENFVHATPLREKAWQHADNAVHEHGGQHHVFEVHPTGPVSWGSEAFPEDYGDDEEMHREADRMSVYPFRAGREVPYAGEELPFTRRRAAREKPTRTKQQVNYREGTKAEHCGNCVMITLKAPDFETHGCTLVKGIIEPQDTCDEWEGVSEENSRTAAVVGRRAGPARPGGQAPASPAGRQARAAAPRHEPATAAAEGHGLDPLEVASRGLEKMSPADRQFFQDALDHVRRGAPPSEPINAEDASKMTRGFRMRDALKEAGFDTSPSEHEKYPRGVNINLPEGHGATLSPNEPQGWHVRTFHRGDRLAEHIHHDLPDSDEAFPAALHRYYGSSQIQEAMKKQRWSIRPHEASLDPLVSHFEAELGPGEYWHSSHTRLEPGSHVDWREAPIAGKGRIRDNFFTTDRDVAHEFATYPGRGVGYVHVVRPTGPFEKDLGEKDSFRSHDPLEVLRVSEHQTGSLHGRHVGASGYEHLSPRSGMVSLDLPEAASKAIAMPGGIDDHHITLVYLGSDVSDEKFEEACSRAAKLAAAGTGPKSIWLYRIGTFPPSASSDGKIPCIIHARVPDEVHYMREQLADMSESEFTDWKPHVTLAYLEPGEPKPHMEAERIVRIPGISVHRGDEVRHFPFG